MGLNELERILPPPESGAKVDIPASPTEWPSVEVTIGISLPPDYKAFIESYGSGSIDRFLSIFNPFAKNPHLNLMDAIRTRLEGLRELQAEFEIERKYSIFPDMNGLLPFGATDNGDVLYWKTTGQPSSWPVVINDARSPEYEEFPIGMTEFLVAILSRKVSSSIFPRAFPSSLPGFVATRRS